ncbi:hypothetical protein F4679DRAFT_592436 [Xylaria curta]|nr:hypothetical protein F4679DRAFT_592436 [Xylaria curta]
MENKSTVSLVVLLQEYLARVYRTQGPKFEQLWRHMGQVQREKAMIAASPHGHVLKHSHDTSVGDALHFILVPEWNLRDVAAAGSDFFLHILEHRATKTLLEQCHSGFDNRPGDIGLINEMICTRVLHQMDMFPDHYTTFDPLEQYGKSFKASSLKKNDLYLLELVLDLDLAVPMSIGELIYKRQSYILVCIVSLVDDILSDAVTTALSNLSIKPSAPKLAISEVLDKALDHKAFLDDNLAIIRTEPVALTYLLNVWSVSRPERISDKKEHRSPADITKSMSDGLLDMMHNSVRGAAIWNYLCRLLELLKASASKSHRRIILQETSNVCYLEFSRVQDMLRRQISKGRRPWRVYKKDSDSNVYTLSQGDPENLASDDQQLQYVLRLSQAEVTIPKAAYWLAKLGEMQTNSPFFRNMLHNGVIEALDDLGETVAFIQSLSRALSLPAINRESGQRFITGATELEIELNQLKPELDLSDFAVPSGKFLKSGMEEAALKALDAFIIDKTGTKMGFLYLDLVDDCITKLHEQLAVQAQQEAAKRATKRIESEYIPFPQEPPTAPEARVYERRQKEKTRPAHSSVYEISTTDTATEPPPPPPPEPFKVKPATAEVFSTLFGRRSSRGSVPWTSFEGALAELKFSVVPKFGSVYTFNPPESMAIQKPLTLHRPHKSHIEGYLLLVFARRLNRLYGWGEGTFQTV